MWNYIQLTILLLSKILLVEYRQVKTWNILIKIYKNASEILQDKIPEPPSYNIPVVCRNIARINKICVKCKKSVWVRCLIIDKTLFIQPDLSRRAFQCWTSTFQVYKLIQFWKIASPENFYFHYVQFFFIMIILRSWC